MVEFLLKVTGRPTELLLPTDRNVCVTDPPRMTGVSIRLRSIGKPYQQRSNMHAELATARCGVILPVWRFGRLRLADHFMLNGGCAHYGYVHVQLNAHPVT